MTAWQPILTVASGVPIGLQLGMTGTGGALLAVPLLVYIAGMTVQEAAAMSLVVVAASSLFGTWTFARAGEVNGRATLAFSWTGMIGAWVGAYGHHVIRKEILLIGFGCLLLLARWLVARQTALLKREPVSGSCPERFSTLCWIKASGMGLGIGLLNGFFGVGGGFMIVAALVLTLGFPSRLAIGTSLSIITIIATTGVAGHLEFGVLDKRAASLVVLGSLIGMTAGTKIGHVASPSLVGLLTGVVTVSIALALILFNAAKLAGFI
ncbi:MAG TPA: sulfite exporter TauE/SafE family protein [Nitrospira sp.]|nr:sulfite exporter TauE/SafE family protein [Nitrospira sp.]